MPDLSPKTTTAIVADPNFVARETAFNGWRSNVILGPMNNHAEDVAYEAFCSGWEAAAPHLETGERPTAAERTVIRPGSDPLWVMSPCCHMPHHASNACPGCGKPADLEAELARRHAMLVTANELIDRLLEPAP